MLSSGTVQGCVLEQFSQHMDMITENQKLIWVFDGIFADVYTIMYVKANHAVGCYFAHFHS